MRDLGFIENDTTEQIIQKIIQGKDVNLVNKLNPRFETTNVADRRLNQIYRTAQTLEEETGSYDLFLGYPFVEGKFIDGSIARCPVLLFPVRLERNLQGKPRWKLRTKKEDGIQFNKTFFLAYELYNQVRLSDGFWEDDVEFGKVWMDWVQAFYEKIKEHEIEVNFNPRLFDLKIETFHDKSKAELDHFKDGVLTFKSQAVLGIFPQSDSSLLNDYNTIEEKPNAFPLKELFETAIPTKNEDLSYIKEENRFFVTEVDQSQEEAILKVKHGKSLVIHGPPGTGKSQVIVNMIADAMAHGKKVLLVSQKRAALDVVYKRLAGLGLDKFSVLVHDYRRDRSEIFRQIKQQIDAIESYKKDLIDLNITKWEHDFKRFSRELDQLSREFEALFQALTSRQVEGINIHDLYLWSSYDLNPFPIKDFAQHSNLDQLEGFITKVQTLWDYGDLLAPTYEWEKRLPFHHYQSEDREKISAFLQQANKQIKDIHQSYTELEEDFGSNILDPSLNQHRLNLLFEANKQVRDEACLASMEGLQVQKAREEQIDRQLGKLEQLLGSLDELQVLDDGHWALLGEILKHGEAYKKHYLRPLRGISLEYQRAKWFFGKIMERKGIKFTPDYFEGHLEAEIKLFRNLHKWYIKLHDKPFFEDFPLLNGQKEKWTWLNQKKQHAQAFFQLKSIKFFPSVKPRFRLGKFDMNRWDERLPLIQAFSSFNVQLQQCLQGWALYLHPVQIEKGKEGFKNPDVATNYMDLLKERLEKDFEDLRDLDRLLADFSQLEKETLSLLQQEKEEKQTEEEFMAHIRQSCYHFWIEQIEKRHPILREVSSRSFPRKERDFEEKYGQKRVRVTELILQRLKESLVNIIEYNRLKNPITFREIYHQVGKKRRLWSVRKLVEKQWDKGLNLLVPCWMASPESASAIFPMEKDFFDLVIFDEASQCFVERAIPIILRGKQAVIAGDNKQLAPTNLYQVRYEEAGEDEFVEDEIALEVNSILDLVINTFEESHLSWHYRSEDQGLINFSNQAFYEGRLQVLPRAKIDPLNVPALNWMAVEGEWKSNRNVPEGVRVIQLIRQLIKREDQPSIGIVTFNYHQQELIKDLLDKELEYLAQHEPEVYEAFQQCLNRYQGEEFQGLFVKNIENVQGDERDIIVFSTAYGYNEKGRLNTNFGLLNQEGGENRLNVAISRARKKIFVVCSFDPAELKVEGAAHEGPRLFKDYLRYVKAVSEGREADAIRILNVQHKEDLTLKVANPIADHLTQLYAKKGMEVQRDVGETRYKIDLAIRKPGQASATLAIECEGPSYFSGLSAKERQVYRKALLERQGWEFKRIWARNFWRGKLDV